jgi:hypothetical protein
MQIRKIEKLKKKRKVEGRSLPFLIRFSFTFLYSSFLVPLYVQVKIIDLQALEAGFSQL